MSLPRAIFVGAFLAAACGKAELQGKWQMQQQATSIDGFLVVTHSSLSFEGQRFEWVQTLAPYDDAAKDELKVSMRGSVIEKGGNKTWGTYCRTVYYPTRRTLDTLPDELHLEFTIEQASVENLATGEVKQAALVPVDDPRPWSAEVPSFALPFSPDRTWYIPQRFGSKRSLDGDNMVLEGPLCNRPMTFGRSAVGGNERLSAP